MKLPDIKSVLWIAAAMSLSACCIFRPGPCFKKKTDNVHKNSKANINRLAGNVENPGYEPFVFPQSEITLPSLFVGKEKSVEPVCFKKVPKTKNVKVAEELKFEVSRDAKLKTFLEAELKNTYGKVGLSTELLKEATSKIVVESYGITQTKIVDLTQIKPDIDNPTCVVGAFQGFVNDRAIITGALKADSISIRTVDSISNALKAKLEAIIDTLNINVKLGFERAVNAQGKFSMFAKNVYFGATTTTMAVYECKQPASGKEYTATIPYGGSHTMTSEFLCSNMIAEITRSKASDFFKVNIYNERAPSAFKTGEFDVELGKIEAVDVEDLMIASVKITKAVPADPKSDDFNIMVNLFIVGPSLEQINR